MLFRVPQGPRVANPYPGFKGEGKRFLLSRRRRGRTREVSGTIASWNVTYGFVKPTLSALRHLLGRSREVFCSPPPPAVAPASRPAATEESDRLKQGVSQRMPDNPCLKGFKVFSQNEEDGIIEEILSRVSRRSAPNRRFFEIGCGNGLENNSHYLLLKGYQGYWIDGDEQNIDFIRNGLGGLDFPALRVRQSFVDLSNVESVVSEAIAFLGTREPDFFSLDIDGNDRWLLEKALLCFEPKVLCLEYNAKFPPSLAISIAYNANHRWAGDDYHGASLRAFCECLGGYRLACCDLSGVNAFFVRKDIAADFPDLAVESLYQPFRERLTVPTVGHPPSLKWLRDKLTLPPPAPRS